MNPAMTTQRCEVAVIGAGPAGLAAASTCARAGLGTVLVDEQQAAGGQIYRSVTERAARGPSALGAEYRRGEALARAFEESGASHVAEATVWSLDRKLEIGILAGGKARMLSARRVILATGAIERPFPVEGWTLPGVMTAGAGQILLKANGMVPSGRVILAGCGPLLWLLASQYLEAGARIDAILDTTPPGNWRAASRFVVPFLRSPYLARGIALVASVRRRVRVVSGVEELRAEGGDRVERVVYRRRGTAEEALPVDTLLLHQGVVPNVNLAMSAGVEHRWSDVQNAWNPVLGPGGRTSVDGIAIAGDGGGIVGAVAAEAQGRLAGFAAIAALKPGAAPDGEEAARGELERHLRGRDFLDWLYRPAPGHRRPSGDTIVCRCEEVTAQEVTEAARLGCTGPNQLKTFLRCGMGPCQGRQCGLTVTELIAAARGVSPQEVGYFRLRPPVKPITVQALAELPKTEAAIKAADR
jgi:thioredoxin reductase/bacterioferritin-associated ferredoxin